MEAGLCTRPDIDPGLFYLPDATDEEVGEFQRGNAAWAHYRRAIKVCGSCPVKAKCLDFALGNNPRGQREDYGVWGGKTPYQRERLPMTGPMAGFYRERASARAAKRAAGKSEGKVPA